MHDQEGKVSVVTGGSSGIGEVIAKRFAKEGAKVLITGRHEEPLKKAADSTEGIDYLALDMTAADAPQKVLDTLNEMRPTKVTNS
ncbi:SDR family NAD(P)-dependent oxidoreductase [Allobaculum mucilyticum]|uniref:SDR family NAD(P)-dependent oxidoreductase n=1 Tax=Allobaculum mucilyticum TaxID=2834459 RepID=UPI001E480364|nr:SDR family NAD(P)-dependent oxidoreductase [Allobaculum mucilyticum]UNT95570.1 SDR family NAD(P)-dependent oxidoreductase [Allobaculum mucilyticum]